MPEHLILFLGFIEHKKLKLIADRNRKFGDCRQNIFLWDVTNPTPHCRYEPGHSIKLVESIEESTKSKCISKLSLAISIKAQLTRTY